ncbi:MAG: HAD family phosphatase [Clostridia bacterium]|nr:HAD family phosphatase [Clostridia bacterium]
MPVRLIVSDIDGTLVGKSGKVSERTLAAFRACEKKNIPIVVASGRTFYGAGNLAVEAGLNAPIISANGGRCDMDITGEDAPVYEDTFDDDMSMVIFRRLKEAGCFMTSYVGKRIYVINETNGFGSTCAWKSEAVKGLDYVFMDDTELFLKEGTCHPYKYEAYSDDKALMDRLRSEFLKMGLSVSSAFPFNLEIMPAGGGKAKAIKALAEKMGVQMDEVMAIGDGLNDLGMIEKAGVSVAMGNAVEALKKAAKYIAPDVEEDGAAIMIERFALMEDR